jgi:O-antigen/teichoic acid export membrane protein
VGIFQANYRLGIFMMLFVSMFEFAWRPFFLQNAREKNAKDIFSKVMTLFILVSALIFLFLTFFIDNIAHMRIPFKGYLIGKAYWGGLNIVPVILLGYLFYGIYINLMAGIYIRKKTKYLPYITGVAAVINVICNFALIPKLNMMASAIATLLSYITMVIGIFIVSQKYYKINYEYRKILLMFLSMAVSYSFYIFTLNTYNHWTLKLLSLIIFVILMFVLKIFDYKTVKRILTPGKKINNV